jgi:hypothetical protein
MGVKLHLSPEGENITEVFERRAEREEVRG